MVNEVVAELDGDFEDGEYDFDGYLDMERDTRMRKGTVLWRETKKELRNRLFLLEQTEISLYYSYVFGHLKFTQMMRD